MNRFMKKKIISLTPVVRALQMIWNKKFENFRNLYERRYRPHLKY